MNKKVKYYTAYLAVVCLLSLLHSCGNNKGTEKNKLSVPTLDSNVLKQIAHINYTLNPSRNAVIECEQGTLIYYYANTLVNSKNKIVKDSITMQVAEFYKAADFIKSNITTLHEKGLLQTGGAVHIVFKQKGKELRVKEGESFHIAYPKTGKKKKMKLYEGSKKQGYIVWGSEVAQKEIDWTKNYGSETGKPYDTTNYYLFTSNLTYWHNCDFMLGGKGLTKLALDLDTLTKANILLVFPSIKSVCSPLNTQGNYLLFYEVAMNYPAILFGYTQVNNEYYYCNERVTITAPNQVLKPKFVKSTQEEIKRIADGIKWDE